MHHSGSRGIAVSVPYHAGRPMETILKISGISRLPSLIKIIIEGLIRYKLFEEFDG